MIYPGQKVIAKVVSVAAHGIHLKYGDVEILVHVTEVPWGKDISPSDYASVGDNLEVKLLRVLDEKAATAWLDWPSGSP